MSNLQLPQGHHYEGEFYSLQQQPGRLFKHTINPTNVEGNVKTLRHKSTLEKDFAAAVYLFEAPNNFVDSKSGHTSYPITSSMGGGGVELEKCR
jgi:hypothetical protein